MAWDSLQWKILLNIHPSNFNTAQRFLLRVDMLVVSLVSITTEDPISSHLPPRFRYCFSNNEG